MEASSANFEHSGKRDESVGSADGTGASRMNWLSTPEVWVALAVGLAAVVEDLWRRQISNWISIAALVGGISCQIAAHGWRGLLDAGLGSASGFLVFLLFYILGGMGGGDVKLMSGFGALLGPARLLEASLWTAAIGGLLALSYLGWQRLRRVWNATAPATDSIPYAPAIAAGVWLSLVPKV
jgi:prepilin peptidase CpaA